MFSLAALLAAGHAAWSSFEHTADLLVQPVLSVELAPTPGPGEINTEGLVSFMGSKVAPILLALLGVIFIGRASKGEISRVLTSSAIAIVGLVFIAGAATLFLVGDSLIRLIFK